MPHRPAAPDFPLHSAQTMYPGCGATQLSSGHSPCVHSPPERHVCRRVAIARAASVAVCKHVHVYVYMHVCGRVGVCGRAMGRCVERGVVWRAWCGGRGVAGVVWLARGAPDQRTPRRRPPPRRRLPRNPETRNPETPRAKAKEARLVAELEDAREDARKSKECCVCYAPLRSLAFIPCGHRCVCEECGDMIVSKANGAIKCPLCKTPASRLMKIYG